MIKKLIIIAVTLLVIGILGSLFTYKTISEAEDITENKVIQEDFNSIAIMSNDARVEIMSIDGSDAKVELSGKGSNYQMVAGVEESVLKVNIDYKQKKLFNFDFTGDILTLKVYLPEKEYEKLQVNNDNGDMKVNDLKAKDVHLEVDNGFIKMNNMDTETVYASTDNGAVDLKHLMALDVDVNSDNGKIDLEEVDGDLVVRANNGQITLVTEKINRSIDFETDNGKIDIQSDHEPTNAILDIKVSNGKVDYFGKSNWDTVIGEGKHLIKLKTDNGKITLSN